MHTPCYWPAANACLTPTGLAIICPLRESKFVVVYRITCVMSSMATGRAQKQESKKNTPRVLFVTHRATHDLSPWAAMIIRGMHSRIVVLWR